MPKDIIKIEGLSKQYRLGLVGTGTLSHDLNRWWNRIRGNDDPYQKISEINNRTVTGNTDYVWALKDLNLDVKQGEVLGIIGKNGAGKSTLLKILSRVTGPTKGSIKVRGRIGSLLEVGTGFHPELTGKENIFLNGAILGMSKIEIRSKLDEIVDFSGTNKYIDTPVKRYSSGMKVRLAFAVAAHLEPEILVIDEVLAVGDADFQQKALGKMKSVSSSEGRTILFVSHNMDAIKSLCPESILIDQGMLISQGKSEGVVNEYLTSNQTLKTERYWKKETNGGFEKANLFHARIISEEGAKLDTANINQTFGIEFSFMLNENNLDPIPNIHLTTVSGQYVLVNSQTDTTYDKAGKYKVTVWIPENYLNSGVFIIGIALVVYNPRYALFFEKEALSITLTEDFSKRKIGYNKEWPGVVRPEFNWDKQFIS